MTIKVIEPVAIQAFHGLPLDGPGTDAVAPVHANADRLTNKNKTFAPKVGQGMHRVSTFERFGDLPPSAP